MYSVTLHNLGKRYGPNTVLNAITFSHDSGVLGIAGSNGSGKSTLLKCMAHLLKPTSGTVRWNKGPDELSPGRLKSSLGYLAPYINLYDELTAIENLHFISRLRKRDTTVEYIRDRLNKVEAGPFASRPFGKLSTGQQQRVKLAAALVHRPDILFLDEPTANLDRKGRDTVHSVVRMLSSNGRFVVLASNSDTELAWCDRIYSVEEENFI